MYRPDHRIVRQVKAYDPRLYFAWNEKGSYFELWRHMENGKRVLITPVTQSVYESKGPLEFAPVDERLVWVLESCDSWKHGGSKQYARKNDSRWIEMVTKMQADKLRTFKDSAKDAYNLINNFYLTRKESTKVKPFRSKRPESKWVKPDIQKVGAPRVFARSRGNALLYNFKK